ncbi:MAG: hypothetical protein HZA36_00275 [Parcubacteria group bacterium]|nr:hypothetical protein [Parcubacteria group bacterium]
MYTDQPNGEWLRIAMEPITDSSGDLCIFKVGQYDDDPWLFWDYGYPEGFWYGDGCFVFVRRK